MKRIYISDWQDRKPVGMRTPVDVFFVFKPEEAHAWPSREQARTECEMYFNPYGVSVDWTENGSEYVCKFHLKSIHRERLSFSVMALCFQGPRGQAQGLALSAECERFARDGKRKGPDSPPPSEPRPLPSGLSDGEFSTGKTKKQTICLTRTINVPVIRHAFSPEYSISRIARPEFQCLC